MLQNQRVRGRFAPSPSGRMHLGNVYSAVLSYVAAVSQGGDWVLRIEDLDKQRCRAEYAQLLELDLQWLGITEYEGGSHGGPFAPYYQSERSSLYQEAYEHLVAQGVVYPCYCRRADLLAARAPHVSDGNVVYSGRCRHLSAEQQAQLAAQRSPAMRLCFDETSSEFTDLHYGTQRLSPVADCGDFVIRRADGSFAYQLAVVVDDALMGINQVVRGSDLLDSTHQQIHLYRLLGYPEPQFAHLPLLMSPRGARLAKRDQGADMLSLRENNSPQQLLGLIAFYANQIDRPEAISLREMTDIFDWERLPRQNVVVG